MPQIMTKSFYYNFMPSKSEEDNCKLQKKPWKPTRYLVEIREMDSNLAPESDPDDPWAIKRVITAQDISNGTLALSNVETFNHILRYWPLDVANSIAIGSMKVPVAMWNYTDCDHPKMYSGPGTFLQKGSDEFSYLLKWAEMADEPWVDPGDELGLYWDCGLNGFRVKIL